MDLPFGLAVKLKKKALKDLIRRAFAGSFVYPVVWLIIGIAKGLHHTHYVLLTINFVVAALVSISRILHFFLPEGVIDRHARKVARSFEISVVLQGLHFGALTTYIYFSPDLQHLVFPMMITAAGCVAAGSATLAINRNIRLMFPVAFMLPMVVSLGLRPNLENMLTASLIIIFYLYIILATQKVYQDYWSSIINEAMLEKRATELESKIEEIKVLSGLLPICAYCKKIRDDQGYWNQLESYIEKRSDAHFSHGICEECTEKLYRDQEWYKEMKNSKQ
jgi:hypothetical protein